MSLRFADSFDAYGVGQEALRYDTVQFASITSSGRNGQGMQIVPGFIVPGSIIKRINRQQDWAIGLAIKFFGSANPFNGPLYVLRNDSFVIMSLELRASGIFVFITNDKLVAQSVQSVHPNTWYYLEIKVSSSGASTITVTGGLTVNGELWISPTSLDSGLPVASAPALSPQGNSHVFNSLGNGNSGVIIDDVYINDDQTLLKDIRVKPYYPASNATPQNWTGSFASINEHPPDGMTTTIVSSTVGDKSIFNYDQMVLTGSIPGVYLSACATSDDFGKYKLSIGPSGSEILFGPFSPPDGNFHYDGEGSYLNEVAAAFTVAGFNAEKFGINHFS